MNKIKPDKKLVRYCEVISMITIIAAAMYGFPNILKLCYEMGKDDSGTFIWHALVVGIESYAIMFIGVLSYVMVYNVRKGNIFSRVNKRILNAIGISTTLSGVLISVISHLSPLEMPTEVCVLFIILGMMFVLIAYIFEIGIRMKEEQELTFDRLKTDIYAYNSKLGCNDGEM